VLARLAADHVDAPFALSLSPTLVHQLGDPALARRYRAYLRGLLGLLDAEAARTRGSALAPVVAWQRRRIVGIERAYFETHGADLIASFRRFAAAGRIEPMTTGATHAVLPLLGAPSGWPRVHIRLGLDVQRRHVGGARAGFWLPECAYDPTLDAELAGAGVRWVVLDTHAFARAWPEAVWGPYAPLATPAGLIAFAREPDGSRAVWSADVGYPGDAWYLDHHRDVGTELRTEYLAPFLPVPAGGAPIGLRYHRVTSRDGDDKAPYDPERAAGIAEAHARDFVDALAVRAQAAATVMDRPPILVYAFDAELFGHWWFEGPVWLEHVLRRVAAHPTLAIRTPTQDLALHPVVQRARPAASSWGAGGHLEAWVHPETVRQQHRLAVLGERLLAARSTLATPAARRVHENAVRHLLAAQASDWTFMISRGTAAAYGRRRIEEHLHTAERLAAALQTDAGVRAIGAAPDRSLAPLDRWAIDLDALLSRASSIS